MGDPRRPQVPPVAAARAPVLRRRWGAPADPGPITPGAWVLSCTMPGGAEADAALWRLHLDEDGLPGTIPGALGPVALAACEDARQVLRGLPWGWAALPVARPALRRVGRLDRQVGPAEALPTLEGRSLTLAALLLFAAAYYGRDLPLDVVAGADIDPRSGRLLPVEGIDAKAAALIALAPGIRTVVVAEVQADGWGRALKGARTAAGEDLAFPGPTVVGLGSATEAVSAVLRPADRLANLSPAERSMTYEHLRRISLEDGMAAGVSWPAVDDALRQLGPHLPGEAATIALLHTVATRYTRAAPVPAPDHAMYAATLALPSARRRNLQLAHALQSSAHAAAPLPDGIEDRLPTLGDSALSHRVRGAWARWRLVVGDEAPELRAQIAHDAHREIVGLLLADDELHELSYSLSDWLRLAGALGAVSSFDEACSVLNRLTGAPDAAPRDLVFASVARARGVWALPSGYRAHRVEDALADLTALRAALPAQESDVGPFAGLGFLRPIIDRVDALLRDLDRDDDMVRLARGVHTVDDVIARLTPLYQPTARAIVGKGSEEVRRLRLLTLYPF